MPITASDWATLTPYARGLVTSVAAAATIAPTSFLTKLTGNAAAVATITPPSTEPHMLALQFAGAAGVTTGGNILSVKASVADQIMLLYYDPATAKYVPIG